jgi:hypothetical protein
LDPAHFAHKTHDEDEERRKKKQKKKDVEKRGSIYPSPPLHSLDCSFP